MKILGIETSSPIFSLCLNEDAEVLHEFSRRREVDGHGDAEIFQEARRLLERVDGEKLGAIAVSIGPGMFTSLRIGLCLAKGVALVKKTPVVAVNTLDVIGLAASIPKVRVAAVVNAYRGEVYGAIYQNGKRISDHLLLTPDELLRMAGGQAVFVGPGVDIIAGIEPRPARIEPKMDDQYIPSAARVISTAMARIRESDFDDIEFLEPYYIKKTDAERYHLAGDAFRRSR